MTIGPDVAATHRTEDRAALYRRSDPAFARWAAGYGVIHHSDLTQVRTYELVDLLQRRGAVEDKARAYDLLRATDLLASAGMWLVGHLTYARNVYLDGRDLGPDDFKDHPEGHMGGSLNVVPAYAGYLAANALSGTTRAWLLGQGHAVSAVDAVNVLVGNVTSEHAERYDVTDEGLTRMARDFYSYEVRPDGRPASPLGSHVNAYTAGGLMEGGYLGFGELQYAHVPLPGETLVAFLSDGSFEEQRGADWAPRWWRAEDTGFALPIMIANGRRIDQRTTTSMVGGVRWFREHARHHGFDPITIDGRDPAAFTWLILEMEARLAACARWEGAHGPDYPVPIPYGIAETVKGYGFPGAGTNRAHATPLAANPRVDSFARHEFNEAARALWVPRPELVEALPRLNNHAATGRAPEKDHPIAHRDPRPAELPTPPWREVADPPQRVSPMRAVDAYFPMIVRENPHLRPRVGNPDELRSNRLDHTLDVLKHRVTAPEPGVAEAVDGAVITALNEEAVVSACLANKAGINLVATYEAFAVKMLGAIRQDLVFARNQRLAGRHPGWLGVPVLATSHTWENGKNEVSHQDPTFAEALMGEHLDGCRVAFPADWNTALACLAATYRTRGTVWTLVTPKREVPDRFTPRQAETLVEDGALLLHGDENAELLLVATGAYQLTEALRAHHRLRDRGIPTALTYLLEPARYRAPRDALEAPHVAPADTRTRHFPPTIRRRLFLTHTRPEPLLGHLRPLDTGPHHTHALGYVGRGGTLDVHGMLHANRTTWAHALTHAARLLDLPEDHLLTEPELQAVHGERDPGPILQPEPTPQPTRTARRA